MYYQRTAKCKLAQSKTKGTKKKIEKSKNIKEALIAKDSGL